MQEPYLTLLTHEKTLPTKHAIRISNAYPVHAVHYIVSGQGYFNGTLLKKGDGFVCFKNSTVEYFPDPNDPWEYYWAHFEGEHITASNCGCDAATGIFHFQPDSCFFETVNYILKNQSTHAQNKLFFTACAALLVSMHIDADASTARNFQSKRHVDMAKRYIASNYHTPLSIGEIASHLHLSRAYLRNIFYRFEGMSPQQYLISMRIRRAKELLKTKEATISEIAASVGYVDPIQFYKIFKKHEGITATEYQQH